MECKKALWNVTMAMECNNGYGMLQWLWNVTMAMECYNGYGM